MRKLLLTSAAIGAVALAAPAMAASPHGDPATSGAGEVGAELNSVAASQDGFVVAQLDEGDDDDEEDTDDPYDLGQLDDDDDDKDEEGDDTYDVSQLDEDDDDDDDDDDWGN